MNNSCPSCGAVYNVTGKDVGRRIKCKKCSSPLIVTDAGLELDEPAPARADVADVGEDLEDAPRRGRGRDRDRGRRAAGPGMNFGETLAKVGGVATLVFGFGAFLVIVFLFMPIIGQAAVQRADAAKEKLDAERDQKLKALLPKGKKPQDLTTDEAKKYSDDADKINKDFEKRISEAEDEARNEKITARRAVYFERYGMMFGFLILMIGSVAFMMPDQPGIRRVVGAVVVTAQMVLVFIAFIIRGAATG